MDLQQTHTWIKSNGVVMDVADMHPRHAQNAYAKLMRKAGYLAAELPRYQHMSLAFIDDELAIAYLTDPTSRRYSSPQAWLAAQPLMRAVDAVAHGLLIEDVDFIDPTEEAYLLDLTSQEPPADEEEAIAQQAMVQNSYAEAVTELVGQFEAKLRALKAQYGISQTRAGHLR